MRRLLYMAAVAGMFVVQSANCQIPYISPGFGISCDLDGRFVFSPKVSVGIMQDGTFYNITLGHASAYGAAVDKNFFIEAQFGSLSDASVFERLQMFYGCGMGVTFPSASGGQGIAWRMSVFSGFLVFLNATVSVNDSTRADLGVELVAPIPLQSIH